MCVEIPRASAADDDKTVRIQCDWRAKKKNHSRKLWKRRRRFWDVWFDLDTCRLFVMTARLGRENNNNDNDNNNMSLILILSGKRLETIIWLLCTRVTLYARSLCVPKPPRKNADLRQTKRSTRLDHTHGRNWMETIDADDGLRQQWQTCNIVPSDLRARQNLVLGFNTTRRGKRASPVFNRNSLFWGDFTTEGEKNRVLNAYLKNNRRRCSDRKRYVYYYYIIFVFDVKICTVIRSAELLRHSVRRPNLLKNSSRV